MQHNSFERRHFWSLMRLPIIAGILAMAQPSLAADCGKLGGIKASDLTIREIGPDGVEKIDAMALFKNVVTGNKKALAALRRCGERGDDDAMAVLAMYYLDQDDVEAMRWFRRAADAGNASAMCNIAIAGYTKGKGGVPKDRAEADKWTLKAAELGDARCQFNLGIDYMLGDGKPEDHAEAARWWRKAAEQGSADAQMNLGVVYEKGDGAQKDLTEARRWYDLAANNKSATDEQRKKATTMRLNLPAP